MAYTTIISQAKFYLGKQHQCIKESEPHQGDEEEQEKKSITKCWKINIKRNLTHRVPYTHTNKHIAISWSSAFRRL